MKVSRRVGRGAALGIVVCALALGGCGRRGKLEAPPDPSNPFALDIDAQTTKKPQAAASASDADQADPKKQYHRRPKNRPIVPPNEPFILDPLL